MGKLTIADLLSFAKAGYTPKDVKELLSLEVPETKKSEDVAQDDAPAPAEKEVEQKTEGKDLQNDSTPTPGDAPAEVIDYKAKCDELEEKMKKLQEQNRRQDMSNKESKDPFSGIDDFLKSIM